MTSKTLLNYCKYSGIWISFVLNPWHWRLTFDYKKPDDMDPALYAVNFSIGPITVKAALDDGSW